MRADWHVERGAFRARGTRWRRHDGHSTNQLWRGDGPSGEWLLKWYRYPETGIHPEPEVAQFLRSQGYGDAPEFGARLDQRRGKARITRAFVQRWVEGASAWDYTVEALRTGVVDEGYARDLGRCVGELHAVLGSGAVGTPFAAMAWDAVAQQRWIGRLIGGIEQWISALGGERPFAVPEETWSELRRDWVTGENGWRGRVEQLARLSLSGVQCRVHGDLHLGQALERKEDGVRRFYFVDFEGEPTRPLAERRLLDTPLRDAAGMLRSFAYAVALSGASDGAQQTLQEAFLDAWTRSAPILGSAWRSCLDGLAWEKTIYEALYEMRHRPDWLWIPLRGLASWR